MYETEEQEVHEKKFEVRRRLTDSTTRHHWTARTIVFDSLKREKS